MIATNTTALRACPPDSFYTCILRFFIPLALQSAAQSLTYPLVAMVASHGPGGTLNLAGLAQSNSVMFLLGTIGGGLLTTGMVFSKSRESFQNFIKVNRYLSMIVLFLQLVICYAPVSHFVFGRLMGLPQSIEEPARLTFLATLPLQFIFMLRNPYQVVLFNAKVTSRAGLATFFRIGLTLAMSPIFCKIGLVGPLWAVVCLTIPVVLEVLMLRYFAKPYIAKLNSVVSDIPRKRKIFLFNFPLSVGGFFLTMSSMIMGAFIARAPNPEIMLPVYYLVAGLVNPFSFSVSRIQTVVLAFPPSHSRDHRTLKFALSLAILVGLLPLLFLIPVLSNWYYVHLQNLSPENLGLVRMTALIMILQPISVAFRSHTEGLAAWVRKPISILSGQAVYLGSIVTIAFFALAIHLPGNLMGPCCVIAANVCAAIVVRLSLQLEKKDSETGLVAEGTVPLQES